jgi:pilus assembly protein Flp/PilA
VFGTRAKARPPQRKGKTEMPRLTLFVLDRLEAAKRGLSREGGQGLVEYALILALISVIAIATMKLIGGSIKTILGSVKDALDPAD